MSKRSRKKTSSQAKEREQGSGASPLFEPPPAPEAPKAPETEKEERPPVPDAPHPATEVLTEATAPSPAPVDELARARQERDEYLELAQRTRADLENFRRRVQREREGDRTRIQAELLRELLGPVDDFDRVLVNAAKDRDFPTLFDGLKMVRDTLWKALAKTGFERIYTGPGTVFDPTIHEAVFQMPHAQHPAGRIIDEVAPGYRLGDLVLRASTVVVSAGPPPEQSAPPAAAAEEQPDA